MALTHACPVPDFASNPAANTRTIRECLIVYALSKFANEQF